MIRIILAFLMAGCCPIITAVPVATSPEPAPTTEIGTAMVGGTASWYDYNPGEAAAGPALREVLGKDWRGQRVRVCYREACTVVVLTDWMRRDRLIDLDVRSFAALRDPSVGLIEVQIELP